MNRISFLNRGYAFKGLLAVFKGINVLKGIVHSFLFDCIYAFDCFTCNYWLNHF